MTARDRHIANKIQLEIAIGQVMRLVGGTGCELTSEQYIADVLKEWSNTRERLLLALDCFTELKRTCAVLSHRTTLDVHRKADDIPLIKGRYDYMAREAHGYQKLMGKAGKEETAKTVERDGWIVCGVATRK